VTVSVTLTVEHLEILERVSRGQKQREIAEAMGMTGSTAGNRCREIYLMLGEPNMTAAVRRALELGLIGKAVAQ